MSQEQGPGLLQPRVEAYLGSPLESACGAIHDMSNAMVSQSIADSEDVCSKTSTAVR
ncbi:hypothetical protein CONPUDRAFT_80232 [Coniophora puteana RWD-64-598 SS2]|uniref:Uncharacterized protein n=1 Tax=Coniophora puteana (strain RWD-64-598) TaxID=741705 RepID=A0A5M3N399_CONPW|nr:uncharacterized protein CONPUDRAFT_80232 [Coniophora puteana RWD-64-598 SS2]EIW85843.1 hypothetical protein CONPUDRAFT_80232 [Coniophora puteana RWD-64-598 SS2]